jgi:peptidyl-prolyl cis-trans isomerase A (cyclophilin A)
MRLTSRIAFVAALAVVGACAPDSPSARPSAETLAARAPDTVQVRFETSKGPFVIEAYRAWSPRGVDRFVQLARLGFFDGVRFFRVLPGFMAQFGVSGDPKVTEAWEELTLPDEPGTQSNARGTITFATSGPNTRTTQMFINLVDNARLDPMGFTPFGRVIEGMAVVDSLYSGYGEGAPDGEGPDQGRIAKEGNRYLESSFPKLDYITKATVVTKTP